MENKTAGHTPGPWHLGMQPGPIVYGPNGEQVADMRRGMLHRHEDVANIRLIAAAPELLEAVKEFMTHVYPDRVESLRHTKAIALMWAAIAKAEGR